MTTAVDDSKLIRVFDRLVMNARSEDRNENISIFEGWSDERKIAYMKAWNVQLPDATPAPNLKPPRGLKHVKVPDSVLCDVSDDETAQQNYDSSIGHYLSWQYSESDLRFEFGCERKRSFVTRSFGTFVFYFRYTNHVVGLVIDGQTGYVEGCITRIYRAGEITQEHVLQFNRSGKGTDYIVSKRTHNLKFTGNYTEGIGICGVNLSRAILRKTIIKIASFRPKLDREEPSPVSFERLILYAAEAPRIRGVLYSTSRSLGSEITENIGIIRIPEHEEPFVLNYKQLSMSALVCIKKKVFKAVSGTTPRNLFHVLSSVVLLRREFVHGTRFLLPDAPRERQEKPLQGERGQQIANKKRLELLNERGTHFSLPHRGEQNYESEPWIMDLWEDSLYRDRNKVLNIPTKINKGTVEIITPVELIKKGDKVGSSESALLAKLGIRPFSYGLQTTNVYEDGSVFSTEVLDLTVEDLIEKFATGVSMVASLSLALSYPTLAAAPHMFINGYKNVLAVAVETDYSYPHADKIKEYLKVGAACVGRVAPVDVVVPPGNSGLDLSGQTSFFQVLNIPTKINKCVVEIITPVELIKKGDKVGSSESALLAKLDIGPFSYGLQITNVYEVLDLAMDLIEKFATGDCHLPGSLVRAPARVGLVAPVDVVAPPGNTGLDPSHTSSFEVLNIPTKINKGTVEIITPVELIKKGDKVGSSEHALLAKLDIIRPFSYGLEITNVYEVLDLAMDLIEKFASGDCHLPGPLVHNCSAPHVHQWVQQYNNAPAVAEETDYSYLHADKIKEYLKDGSKFAVPAGVACC